MKLTILSLFLLAVLGSGGAFAAESGSDRAPAATPVPSSSPEQQDEMPDGEATVYLLDDYAGHFDLNYTIRLRPQPKNASWSTLGVMLIGTENPGPSIQIGLAQENATTMKVFTSIGSVSGADEYNGYPFACVPDCDLELRGDDDTITALASGQVIGKWSRSDIILRNPYVQINGEVHGAQDAIDGTVTLKKASAGTMPAKTPVCGYVRGGIVARALPGGAFAFSGIRDDGAPAYYNAIADGHKITDCSSITATPAPPVR